MAKKKKVKSPEEQIEAAVAAIVVDSEYKTAASLRDDENEEFESLIQMLECRRNEKDYEWMSDSYIPEMNSIYLTDCSQWANQYFQSRDFIEAKLDGDQPEDKLKAEAAKKIINLTLNNRSIYYYPKYIRMRSINSLRGVSWMLCWWERETVNSKRPIKRMELSKDFDIYGNPLTEETKHLAAPIEVEKEEEFEVITLDRFNCEALDPRNVFTDSKYCYSAQQKDWIIVRSESSYDDLKANEKKNEYFNLDKVKEAIKTGVKSDTARETYGKEDSTEINKTPVTYFDVLDRYGKFWAVVTAKDKGGYPETVKPGIGDDGLPLDDAELIETIITYVVIGNSKIMIRFIPTPYIDSQGRPYKPLARGLCYIHPTKDDGLSDGRLMKELQANINDTWNMGQDRVKLATLPMFVGKKSSLEDNNTVFIEPEHVIELEGGTEDLKELVIRDNIKGSLDSLAMLKGAMQQALSTYPTTMGALPDSSSTTATAVAGAETRTNARANYKSLTFEYMMLQEFYWIILQMTYRFADDTTISKMLGSLVQNFPDKQSFANIFNADYTYSPVTSNIETEYNKYKKIQLYDQIIGRVSGLAQSLPAVVPIIAHMIGRQLVLQGDEYQDVGKMIDALSKQKPQQEGGEGTQQPKDMGQEPTSNQSGIPMGMQEMAAREMSMAAQGGMIK